MSSLFIIGNGFDIDHRLKTSYNDFRKYLLSCYSGINMSEFIIPNEIQLPDGGIEYNEEEVLSMIFYLINEAEKNEELWSDIEIAVGDLDFSQAFEWFDEILDKEGDIEPWETSSRNENLAYQLVNPTVQIQHYFSEWINSIDLSPAIIKEDFIKLLNYEDKFLTFNYTETLEKIYNINKDNICHIHGKQNEELYFGHGNMEEKTDFYMQNNIGSQDALSDIDRQLRKDTSKALNESIEFFINLKNANITNVYSYGFSFNEVDTIYMEEICNRIETENVVWLFNDYDSCNIGRYTQHLRRCGFKGEFSTFHIKM